MKKYIFSLVAVVLIVTGFISLAPRGTQMNDNKQPVLPNERSIALDLALTSLSEGEKDTLVPGNVPTIQKIASYKPWNQEDYIESDHLYKVTFRTSKDAMIGPIVMYIDANKQEIIGYDIRH